VSIASASLIIAAAELSVVRLIRGAMRAADLGAGRCEAVSGLGPAPNCDCDCYDDRRHIEPTAVYEPRRHIEPTPRYEARTVYYSIEYEARPRQVEGASAVAIPIDLPSPARPPVFPPVWKVLPPIEADLPVRRPIKIVRHHPDIRHRGIVIDVHA
jgi:hypothetical protein